MNGQIQRAQLFADVDALKTSVNNILEGCDLLVEMDTKLMKQLEEQFDLIEKLTELVKQQDERLDLAHDRLDIAAQRLRLLEDRQYRGGRIVCDNLRGNHDEND